jgi:DNA-binding GntR family transcriptional regulator
MDSAKADTMRAAPRYARFSDILERSIRKGLLGAGVVLLEGPIAQIFGSSRAPVRQALQHLHRRGMVNRFEGRGFVVGSAKSPIRRVELSPAMFDINVDQQNLRRFLAWEEIYESVERAIVHRSVFGRFRVNELELARHYGVGRAVARDVLSRLQSLGMIEKDERQRWMTVPHDAERLGNLYEIREQLEPVALRKALPLLNHGVLENMRKRIVGQIKLYPNVSATAMDDLEFDLHVRCLMPCPNREMLGALQRTRCVLTLSKHVLGVALPLPRRDPFMTEHRDIFDAMLASDGRAAAKELRRHLRASRPKVIDRLQQFRASFTPPTSTYIA